MGGPDQPQPALGAAVRQLREKHGTTQERLAQDAGVTTGTISLVERGRSNPSWGTVNAIADGLGVSMAELARLAKTFEGK
ncbi:MAG TPA: helix-turn-helix transcriptional regulator [Solirubrobacterales bacterium]|nr:helix-turn-helix transcriptional regulator [Solirubrobacterales bacterium]